MEQMDPPPPPEGDKSPSLLEQLEAVALVLFLNQQPRYYPMHSVADACGERLSCEGTPLS